MGAAKKVLKAVTSWAYSALTLYDQCPRRYKHAKLEKLPDPIGPAGERGNLIHKLAERFMKRELKKLPAELTKLAKEFKALLKKKGVAEEEWAWLPDWVECTWFDKGAWLRVKIDHRYMLGKKVAVVIDYKTGKIRDGYEEQLWLYAMATFRRLPDVEEVRVQLWYTDQGIIIGWEGTTDETRQLKDGGVYTRAKHQAKFEKHFAKRIQPMFHDKRFLPRPGQHCKWCNFAKTNGGPCTSG